MNVNWISHLPAPARRGLYFGLQRAIGSHVSEAWREFLACTKLSPEQLRSHVEGRLDGLLMSALGQSEYYRNLELVRKPDETAHQFLQRFPILTREKVREHFAEIVVDSLRAEITSPSSVSTKRYDWLVVKTGGTTGIPTSVVHDARTRDWGRATRLFSAKQCGFPLGTRYFRLWGSETDLLHTQATLQARVLQNVLGEIQLNAFRAKESELRQHYVQICGNPKVQYLMTYVDAAVSLALFIQDKKLPPPHLKTLMACAGTVTPEWRLILESTFSTSVFDKYGSRECCDIACECNHHTGLHVYSPNVFVEIVDEEGRTCPPGKIGKILVTLLNNTSFPMIRYEIGDVGEWAADAPCPCGLAFPRIASIQGRQDDMLITQDGTLLSSVFVRHFVGVSLNKQLIREWQLEQIARDRFIFRYIPLSEDGLTENIAKIRSGFLLALGGEAEIKLERVSSIPPSATGKIRWIINSMPAKQPESRNIAGQTR